MLRSSRNKLNATGRQLVWRLFSPAMALAVFVVLFSSLQGCHRTIGARGISGLVDDEAKQAHRPASSFPAADEDYFHDMDGGIALSSDEIKGRNTWIVWTAGNDRLWDKMVNASAGAL